MPIHESADPMPNGIDEDQRDFAARTASLQMRGYGAILIALVNSIGLGDAVVERGPSYEGEGAPAPDRGSESTPAKQNGPRGAGGRT